MEEKRIKYSASIDKTSFEVLNSEFTKAKAYILYYGENRNGSKMSKECVESAIPTLYNIPIVAEWIEKKEDFGTHGGKIIISDAGIEYIQTTKPYGLVPESCNARWEMVDDKEYLVADIILWSGRYEELQKTVSDFSNQSMEINVSEGVWDKDIYDIGKFEFSALCLLGQDTEPCFEQAKVVTYGLDEFKNELNEMFKNYKCFSEISQKGGENLGDNAITNIEKVSFSASYKQRRDALNNALDPIIVRDEEGNYISETYYYVEDFTDEYVMVEKSYWSVDSYECTYGRFTYSFDETTLTATITSEFEKMVKVWLTEAENQKLQEDRMALETMSKDFEALKLEVENYKNSINSLETEKEELNTKVSDFEVKINEKDSKISELQEYQNKKELEIKQFEIDEIISDFESVLGDNEEFKAIKEKAMEYEIEVLQKELFALEGKIKHTKTVKPIKKTQNFSSKVSVVEPEVVIEKESYYGDAVKYIPKK